MSLLFGPVEAREAGGAWADAWRRGDDVVSAGSMDRGLRLAPVYSAVGLISDAFASLPCRAYTTGPDGSRLRVENQPMLLTDPGVGPVTRVTWRHQAMASLLLCGNAVGVVASRDRTGTPEKIIWLRPDAVTVDPVQGINPRYFYNGRQIPPLDVVHVAGFTLPGSVWGLSPLSLFRLQIEGGLEAVAQQRRWWKRPQPPAMVKNTAKKLQREEAQAAKASWMASMDAGEPWFAGMDWDYTALTVSNADARFVEAHQATANQIAAIYHVPPDEIGGTAGSSLTYSTVELNGIKFGQRAVLPWTVRFEAVLDRLLPAGQYSKFNLDVLARTDLQGRMNAYEKALDTGVMTNDEARALEDRPPLTDDQRVEWQSMYAARNSMTGNLSLAEKLQKIYLAVGKVISADEAREILNRDGANLSVPGPSFSATNDGSA